MEVRPRHCFHSPSLCKIYLTKCVCSVAQSCLTLYNSMYCSLPSSSVHGISQARILEFIAISFSSDTTKGKAVGAHYTLTHHPGFCPFLCLSATSPPFPSFHFPLSNPGQGTGQLFFLCTFPSLLPSPSIFINSFSILGTVWALPALGGGWSTLRGSYPPLGLCLFQS